MIDSIFLQISVLLGLTVTIAFLMRILRQPLMVGYLIAGIVAGPFFLNLLQGDTELFHALAEFGVVLLLFVVGLSLNFDHIKKIGKVALLAGLSQVIFSAGIGFLLLYYLLGFTLNSAMYLAIAITFSSTIVIVKLLTDKKDTQSVYGRYTLGLMVVQDILALLLLIVLTSITGDQGPAEVFGILFLKIFALIALVVVLGRYVVPHILNTVAKSTEFLFIFTLAWCFGVSSILYLMGFSVEVGALVAGLTLASSNYQSEISSRIKPLRDFFIVIFFLILGSELSLANLGLVLIPGIILSVFVLFGNPFILYRVFRNFRFTRRNSFLAGITAAQVSEFGFVLLLTGRALGHINGSELEVFTLVALSTIIISSYVITYNEQIYKKMLPFFQFFGSDRNVQHEQKPLNYQVWVFGYHRTGWKICEALKEEGKTFAVVDFDPAVIQRLKHSGIPAYYGDAADIEFLEQLPFDKAKMVISTLPELNDQKTLIQAIRSKSKKTLIITNLYEIDSVDELYKAGANYVMMPHLLGGNWMAELLKNKRWTKTTFSNEKKSQRIELQKRFSQSAQELL